MSLAAYFQHHFPQADAEVVQAIASQAHRRRFARQEHVLQAGEICRFIGYVEQGALRTYQLRDGVEKTFYFALEGEWITSYYSFLTGRPADVHIECLEAVELLMIPQALLMDLYQTSLTANQVGRRIVEGVYLQEYERKKDLLTLSAPDMYQKLVDTRPELLHRVQLQHIASYLGIAKESLSRIRRNLGKS